MKALRAEADEPGSASKGNQNACRALHMASEADILTSVAPATEFLHFCRYWQACKPPCRRSCSPILSLWLQLLQVCLQTCTHACLHLA